MRESAQWLPTKTIGDVRLAEEAGFTPAEIAYMFDEDVGADISDRRHPITPVARPAAGRRGMHR